jgi:hypothetical protein
MKGRTQAKKITKTEKLRVLYWKKEEEFSVYVKQFERVGLVKTWVKEWSWGKNSKKVVA